MPYVGRDLQRGNYLKLDDITSSFDGSTTTFNLQSGGSAFYPGSAFSIFVVLSGLAQEPESAYTINKNTITFASAPTAVDDCFITVLGVALGVGVPGHGTVNGSQLAKPFNYDGGLLYLDSTNDRIGVGVTTPSYTLDVTGTANFSGNVTIGGTLTYQDVASIDAVGIATFQDDVYFNGTGAGISSSYWDKSANEFKFKDNVKLSFGDGRDLQLQHNNSDSVISHISGATGNLKILSGGAQSIECIKTGAVNIAHNGTTKLSTTSTGATLDHTLTIGGAAGSPGRINFIEGGAVSEIRVTRNSDANSDLQFKTERGDGTQVRAKINYSGDFVVPSNKVGIATVTPNATLDIHGANSNAMLRLTESAYTNTNKFTKIFEYGGTTYFQSRNDTNNGAFVFRGENNSTTPEFLRIDSNGRILAGTTSSSTNTRAIIQGRSDNAATTGTLHLQRGAANPGNNSGLGKIIFADNASAEGAYIWAQAAGQWASNDYPTYLTLATTADNASSPTERLRITSDGKILHNNANSYHADADDLVLKERGGSNVGMTFQNTGTGYGVIYFADSGSQHSGRIQYDHSNDSLDLFTGGSERVAIHSTGQVEFKNGSFSNNVNCVMASGSTLEIGATATIKLRTATNERLQIDSNGSVHVGFSGESLYFQNGFNNSNARIQNAGASNNSNLRFLTRNAGTEGERVRIGSDGNVNFGANKTVSMPSGTGIQVYHSANPRIKLVNDTTGNTSTDGFQLYLSGSGVIFDHKENAEMRFYTNALERLRIQSTGQLLYSAASGDNIITSKRTNAAGSDGNYFFHLKATDNNDNNVGELGFHRDTAVDDSRFIIKTRNSGGSSTERLRITSAGKAVFSEEIETPPDYPVTKPSLHLNFAATKSLDPRIKYYRHGPASYVDQTGRLVLVGENIPRFDHDITTRECKGLLIEGARTNLITNSTLKTDGAENNITKTRAEGPDGVSDSALQVTFTASGAAFIRSGAVSCSASTEYTFSIWIKKVSGSVNGTGAFYSYVTGSADGLFSTTGFVNTDGQSLNAQPTGVWKRFTQTKTTPSGTSAIDFVLPGYDSNGLVLQYYGLQLEAGGFATSFIPTYGYTQTRGEDFILIDGTEFTDFFNPTEGTSVVHAHMPNSSGASGLPAYAFKNSVVSAVNLGLSRDNNASPAYHYYNDGTNNGFTRASATGDNMYKGAMSFKTSDFDSYVNGSANTNTTTFTMPTIDNLRIGGTGGANQLGGHVARFMYYPVKLSNSQLITLTS